MSNNNELPTSNFYTNMGCSGHIIDFPGYQRNSMWDLHVKKDWNSHKAKKIMLVCGISRTWVLVFGLFRNINIPAPRPGDMFYYLAKHNLYIGPSKTL